MLQKKSYISNKDANKFFKETLRALDDNLKGNINHN